MDPYARLWERRCTHLSMILCHPVSSPFPGFPAPEDPEGRLLSSVGSGSSFSSSVNLELRILPEFAREIRRITRQTRSLWKGLANPSFELWILHALKKHDKQRVRRNCHLPMSATILSSCPKSVSKLACAVSRLSRIEVRIKAFTASKPPGICSTSDRIITSSSLSVASAFLKSNSAKQFATAMAISTPPWPLRSTPPRSISQQCCGE